MSMITRCLLTVQEPSVEHVCDVLSRSADRQEGVFKEYISIYNYNKSTSYSLKQ